MGENVQCPVCTLYLHAGMNLSDHLETHPKEQVIRALVEMTISGVGGSTSVLSSVLKGVSGERAETKKQSSEDEGKSLLEENISDSNVIGSSGSCNANVSNSTNHSSFSNQSTTISQNAKNVINFPNSQSTDSDATEVNLPVKSILKSKETPTPSKEQPCKEITNDIFTNAHRTYSNATNELPNAETNFTIFGNQRYLPQQRQVGNQANQQMPPPPVPQTQHPDISRTIPPPPLPQTIQPIHNGYHSLQCEMPHHPPPQHGSHMGNLSSQERQGHIFAGQQLTTPPLHQADLKVIYSSELPPPPPLQLFSYQSPSQLQHHHQKPPPAYGTAISQIRSQNKHQVSGPFGSQHQLASITSHSHHDSLLHQQQQIHSQQPSHQQHVRMHGTMQQTPDVSAKHMFSKTNDMPSMPSSSTVSPLISRLAAGTHQQQLQGKFIPTQQQQQITDVGSSTQCNNSTANDNQNKIVKGSISVSTSSTITHSAQSQVAISPAVASASIAAVAASTLSRHTNSPFAALLAAAAGAPSPSNTSSVLRYAESPVAHYLERDNGDFIVQETPKHIVECVEKDNGEFSVIERIYQSPPSVLHIHDDADDDDDDAESAEKVTKSNNDANNDCDDRESKEEIRESQGKNHVKKRVSIASSSSSRDDNRNPNKISFEAKYASRKCKLKEPSSLESDVMDFVSISSDSDEEEFISHEKKLTKHTAEKSKKIDVNTLPTAVTSEPRSQHSTLSTADANSVPTSYSPQSNSSSAHQNGTRKKSSKNTITVLSDVQLNLNEYLDLVGNIIASSKVAAQRRSFTSIAPIPLVKIEKEEPMDDYTLTENVDQQLPPTPLKANKQETEELTDNHSSSSSSNISNNITLTDQTQLDRDEKKPQVIENIQENNVPPSSLNINTSQVTSVIRMASTSQNTLHPLPPEHLINRTINNITESVSFVSNDCAKTAEAEDLSYHLRNNQLTGHSKTLGQTTLGRKGPKKLVIKPKPLKNNTTTLVHSIGDDQQPSTSAKALKDHPNVIRNDEALTENEVQVKNEPIASITFENHQYHPHSILEQHLTSKEPILVCKEEKPCIQESSLHTSIKELKIENNVNEDARVLYDFATSKKANANSKSSTFPSPTSVFAKSSKANVVNKIGDSNDSCNSHLEPKTCSYACQSDVGAENACQDQTKNTSSTATSLSEQNPQIFSDFPFNYLYACNDAAEQVDIKNSQQLSTIYQTSIAPAQNASNTMVVDDSSSSKNCSDYHQKHATESMQPQNQWISSFQTTSDDNGQPLSSAHSNSNLHTQLSAECSRALDVSDVGKYLEIDTCKREQNADLIGNSSGGGRSTPPPPSSCTSSSFTDNSMAGICSTAGTLNIRTDEKMPAKGEISEQESNCDIDNSWSQPIYGDISARFFKTNFPGIFQPDNGWNHEEYFTVQDLSASSASHTVNVNNSKTKSFDFRLPSEESSSVVAANSSSALTAFSQNSNDNCNIDTMPSTSAKIRKRRKRNSQDGKMSSTGLKRTQPTSTITSQQMAQNHSQSIDYNFMPQEQQPSTSSAFLAGPSIAEITEPLTSLTILSQQVQQQKIRTKVYECGHCNVKYSKLKDRNAHMVDAHNYVRQNRRLVCLTNGISVPITDVTPMGRASGGGNEAILAPTVPNSDGSLGDFKQGIVKVENENSHRDVLGFEQISADIRAKTEVFEDDKRHLSLVQIEPSSEAVADSKQSNFKPISLTTNTSKLTTLYRMLVTFNMTTLKQSHRMSEFDENSIKSSIFFCYVCRQNFNSVKLYDAHLTEHPAECFTCGKKFQRWKNFSLHLKRHLGWKEFGCTVCDKKFVVRSALVEHMRMHSGLSPLKCKVCGKHFKRYSNLTQHRKRHTKQVVRRKEYVCYCGEVLPSKARFLWHKETHDSKPKCCPHCCDRFVHVNSLRRHIRLAHSEKFDYTEPKECPICKQIFAKASMKAHMATHSTDTQYDCAICNKSFSTKWNLKIHSWVHANRTAKPFKCEHCPKAFVREVDFKNHMNSHKQIKPYTCEVCGCKFIRKYNYMRHRREHHGNKKYTCDLCKKSFHRHYYLIEHKRIHTGERPFQCTICGKSSTTKTNHNKHLKIHHSRDPFTVEV
uniref:C2H2-type domain-containing protein n=1 Tax=Stomoxys calcitrans TaxID=35570 RepID=A0A1I8NQ57_STOCA